MKVLFLSDFYPPDIGGGSIAVKNLVDGLTARGVEVKVLTSKSFLRNKLNKFYTNYLSLYNPRAVKIVKEEIFSYKPDIVHAHNIYWHLSYHSLKIAKESGAKVFLTAHDVMSFNYRKADGNLENNYKANWWQQLKQEKLGYFPLRNILIRCYLNNYVNKIIAVSHALEDALSQNGINNVSVIHNGVDVSFWQNLNLKKKNDFIKKHCLENKKVIFFGGRISSGKGITPLLLACKNIPGVRLLIAGDTKGLKFEKNVIPLGVLSQEEMRIPYHVCDLFVTPSTCFDSFPTMNLEAMACGKPVIATIFGGSKEAVIDNHTGYIVNPLETENLAGKIINLLSKPELAAEFGKRGKELVRKKFGIDNQVKKILMIYNLVAYD